MSKAALAALIGSSLLASGCASVGNLTSIYRRPDLSTGDSVVLDAEQWAVLNIPWPGNNIEDNRAVCAMPSPDALAAAAAAGGLNVNDTTGSSAAATLGVGETAASIGLRTQSIQLLRDAMYRLCESYANGAINASQYSIMMRRHQSNMIAILAIEQLTGAVAAQNVAVSATAEASVLQILMNERQTRTQERERVLQELRTLNVQIDSPDTPEEVKVELRNRKQVLERRQQELETDISHFENALDAVTRGEMTGGNFVLGAGLDQQRSVNDVVANAVRDITIAAMRQEQTQDLCFELILASSSAGSSRSAAELSGVDQHLLNWCLEEPERVTR